MEKYEYCKYSGEWFPNRRDYPWRRIKKWVSSRIEHLQRRHNIDASLKNYREHLSQEPTKHDISLVLDNLRLQVRDEGIAYRYVECGKEIEISEDATLDSLRFCEHVSREFIADFFRERKAIEQAFLEESYRAMH